MKLTVSNFQIHKAKTLDIPDGKTTYLEGDSDTGKSAMFRALRWVCENKPDGGSFVTIGSPRGTTSVAEFEVEPGLTVTRERGKSKNLYVMNGVRFEAFGRSVPEPVTAALRLSPYAFQCQGEPPFLVGMSPTEAAKILTDACGLGAIDTAVGHVRAKKTANDAELRKTEILLTRAQEWLEAVKVAVPAADALERAAGIGEEVEAISARAAALRAVLDAEPKGEEIPVADLRSAVTAAFAANDALEASRAKADKLKAALAAEPTGSPYATAGAAEALALAERLAEERTALAAMLKVIAEALASEPVGGPVGVCGASSALAKASALKVEIDGLRKRELDLRILLGAEPSGSEIDTAGLLEQRARIKVCPTCGREM